MDVNLTWIVFNRPMSLPFVCTMERYKYLSNLDKFSHTISNVPLAALPYRDRITDHDIIATGLVSVSEISRSGEDGNTPKLY